jgi:Protein of unknown function (DUF1761)
MRETGLTEERLKQSNMGLVFGLSFLLALVAAVVFAFFLGSRPAFAFATQAGVAAGVGWVATSFGINYLFERKSFALFAINAGYHVVQFTLIGVILGAWS